MVAGSRRKRAARLATLRRKASELSILCGVRVAVVCADGEGHAAQADVWESKDGVLEAYRALPAAVRAAHNRAYAEAELGKAEAELTKVREDGPAALALGALEGARPDEATIDAVLEAVKVRQRELAGKALARDDEEAASLSLDGGSNRMNVEGSSLSLRAKGHGDTYNSGQAMNVEGSNSFNPYPGGSYQLQMAVGVNGYGDSTATNGLAFQPRPRSAAPTRPAGYYANQCSGAAGYHAPSHAGFLLQPNARNASAGYRAPSHAGYLLQPNPHNVQQGYGSGNFLNAPTDAHNFTNYPAPPAAAYPRAISYGGNPMMNASGGYTTQWPAQAQAQAQQQLQSASSSQQSGDDQFFTDLDDTQLQLWGN